MLSADLFQTIIKHAPLFAKDFVVINEDDEILVGKRLNASRKSGGLYQVEGYLKTNHFR